RRGLRRGSPRPVHGGGESGGSRSSGARDRRRHATPLMARKSPSRPETDPRVRALRLGLLGVVLVLALTSDERTFGPLADEQQVLYTGVSMAEHDEIGIARGALFTVHRPAGDAVSPYGIGLSLVNAVPAFLASSFEKTFGAGSSNTLFVAFGIVLVALAAAG